jgi:hypothetical protein
MRPSIWIRKEITMKQIPRVLKRAIVCASIGTPLIGGVALAADNQKLALTIYNTDLALVQDTRTLDLAAGRSRLEFKDVSASIRPETVALSAPGVSIVEQNFDFDLLTPEKLMEKAVGQQVQIVRINPGNGGQVTETATVLSVNNGVVLKAGDKIEVLRADNVPTRVIFDKVPDNLRARPTLSVSVATDKAGRRDTTLSYLTTGLSWKADYVALFDEKAGKLDMQGWITLTNTSGTTFTNADTQLIAGNINIVRNGQEYDWREQQRRQTMRTAGNDPSAKPPLADYYVYPLAERTTVADKQTKQVGFLEAKNVTASKAYQYRADWFTSLPQPVHANVVVQFSNSAKSGLGAQLPAGVARVYVRDVDGKPKFVGENSIDHTPQGSELSIKTGEAFDITVQPTLVSQERAGLLRSRYNMEYLIRNARKEAATVEIRQSGLWRDGKVLNESIKSTRVDAYTLQWSVPVPANGETKLTFGVETGW